MRKVVLVTGIVLVLLTGCGGGGGGGGLGTDSTSGGTSGGGTSGGGTTPPASAAKLVAIKLASSQADALAPGTTLRYAARGTYSDKAERVISGQIAWSSSDSTIAVARSGSDEFVYVDGLKPGQAVLTASLDGVSLATPVTVLPIKTLDYHANDVDVQPFLDTVSITAQGQVLASVAHAYTAPGAGTVNAWKFDPPGTWSEKTQASAGVSDSNIGFPVVASNARGQAVLAWSGRKGVYAARYSPGTGWQAATVVASGPESGFLSFGTSLQISMDPNGNAMLLWIVMPLNAAMNSRYDAASGSWSAPVEVPGSAGGASGGGVAYTANAAGDGVMIRERWNNTWDVVATRYSASSGWGTPQVLRTGVIYTTPQVAMGGAGAIVVVGSDTANGQTYAVRYDSTAGWSSVETLDTTQLPRGAKVAVNDAGQAVAVWCSAYAGAVYARRYLPLTGWEPTTTLTNSSFVNGEEDVLKPFIAADGRIFATWNAAGAYVAARRFSPSTGWTAQEFLRMGFKGSVIGVHMAFNESGNGAVIWGEGYDVPESDGFSHRYYDFYIDTTLQF